MINIARKIYSFLHKHPIKTRLGVVVILFSILIYNIHPAEILTAIKDARPLFLLYAAVLMIPNLLLQIFKWQFVMRDLKPKVSFKTVAVSLFGGFFLGVSTPGRTGELARGILIPDHSTVKIASLSIVDKGFSQLMVYLSGLTALCFIIPWPFKFIPFLVQVVIVVVVFNIHRLEPKLEKFLHRFTNSERVDHALAAFDTLSTRTVLGLFCFTIPFYLTFTFQYYLLIRCFTDLSLIDGLKSVPLIFFFNTMLPIAIGDFGVKEFFAVHILTYVGISGGPAFSATVTHNVLTFIVPGFIGGIVFMLAHPRKKRVVPASNDDNAPLSKK